MHGCASELEALLSLVDATRVISVGDLFTKGPDPVGVWRLVRSHRMEAVLGNHEVKLLDAALGRRHRGRIYREAATALDEADPAWRHWALGLPLFLEAGPWTVVHAGLHPSGDLSRTTEGVATTVRRWPPDDAVGPWWHEVYTGARRVLFGHDAVRGLVDHRPMLLGLDTGCVYGGSLTGYVVEADELLSIPATGAYRPA